MYHQKPLLGTPINWAHPLARGLTGAFLFNEGVGDRVNDYSLNNNFGTNLGYTWVPGGISTSYDGTTKYVSLNNRVVSAEEGTIFLYAKIPEIANKPWLFSTQSVNRHYFYINPPSARMLYSIALSGTRVLGLDQRVPGSIFTTAATWVDFGTIINGYYDGVLKDTASGVNTTTPVAYVRIGTGIVSTDTWNSDIYCCLIYNRALSSFDINELNNNPYCMFDDDIMMAVLAAQGSSIPTFQYYHNQARR